MLRGLLGFSGGREDTRPHRFRVSLFSSLGGFLGVLCHTFPLQGSGEASEGVYEVLVGGDPHERLCRRQGAPAPLVRREPEAPQVIIYRYLSFSARFFSRFNLTQTDATGELDGDLDLNKAVEMKAMIQEQKEQAAAIKQAAKLQELEARKRKRTRSQATRSTAALKSKSLSP